MSVTRYFKNGDVVVFIPDQKNHLKVDVKEIAPPTLTGTTTVAIGFHPFRMVIGLEFYNPASSGDVVAQFDPAIEVSIRYTDQDMSIAKNAGRDLLLGFWDGKRWLRFTVAKHAFKLEPDKASGGWGKVKVKDWSDPAKAWGT